LPVFPRRCAGPRPVLGACGEPCLHGIPFDVLADAFEFGGVSDPMIEAFVLPEGFAGPAQGGVCIARRDALHDVGDLGQWHAGLQQDMDVVGHDDVGVQDVPPEFGATFDGIFRIVRNLRVAEPARPGGSGVQVAVECQEFFFGRGRHGIKLAEDFSGQRAIEAPSEEDGPAIRDPVGKIAAVEGHGGSVAQPFLAVRFCFLENLAGFAEEREGRKSGAQPRMAVPL